MSKEQEWVEERESQRKAKVGDWVHIARVGINGPYKVIEIIDVNKTMMVTNTN